MLAIAVALAVLVLAACTQEYRKIGISQRQADLDSRYCQAVARGAGGPTGSGLANIVSGMEAEAARYEACMLQKGFRPAESHDLDGWARAAGHDIEERISGRAIINQYAEEDRKFRAEFRRDGVFSERWSKPIFDRSGNPHSAGSGRWFVQGDLLCEEIIALSKAPFCGALYERLKENREAYRFVDPQTGRLVSYSTDVETIEPLH